MAEREQRGASLLQVPVDKRIRGVSPVRYRSRSKSKRSRSGSPLPYLMRDNREKSPFEIGEENKTLMRAAPKAVFDKALVMDISPSISKPGDEEIIYITTDMSVIDKAHVMDISSVTYYVLEDEDEEEEIEIELDEIPEEGIRDENDEKADGEEQKLEKKKVIKKVVKKKKKKVVKKEETPPPTLKLEIKVPKKDMKTMFEQKPSSTEEPPTKKPMKAAKLEKLKLIEQMKAEAAAAAAAEADALQKAKKPSKWDKKAEEKPKTETIEEKMKRIKEEQVQRAAKPQDDGGLMAVLEKQKKKLEEAKKKAKDGGGVSEPYELPSKKHDTGEKVIDFKANLRKTQIDTKSPPSSSNEDNYGSVQENGLRDINIQTRTYDSDDESDEDESEESEEDDQEQEDNINDDGGDVFGNSDEPPLFELKSSKNNMTDGARKEEEERVLTLYKQDEMEKSLWKSIADEEDPIPSIKSKDPPVPEISEKEKDKEWKRNRDASRLPIINNFLTDRTLRQFENLKLTCSASGPDLQIKWYRNGSIVDKGPRAKIGARDGLLTLEVPKADITDSGQYACSMKNKNGEVSTSCIVKIYKEEHDAPMAPTFTSVRDYYHLHDNELIIECHIRGEPDPKVTWFKDGLEIVSDMKYDIHVFEHGFHRLTMNKPMPNDSGKYVIKAENKVKKVEMLHNVVFTGKESHYHVYGIFHANPLKAHRIDSIKKAHEETMQIIAQAGKKVKKEKSSSNKTAPTAVSVKNKLNFDSILRDRTSLEGTKVKLVCVVSGPDPQMKWYKNDIPLVFGAKIRNGSRDGIGCVEFTSVTEIDTAEYKCIAKNGFNEISSVCHLQVYPTLKADTLPPTFIMGVRDIYHAPENDLIIDCKVRAHPAPKITWLLNEIEVVNNERIQQYDHHDGVCELIINKPSSKDSGTYTCCAENNMGIQKSVHRVIVERMQPSHDVRSEEKVVNQMKHIEKEANEVEPAAKGKPKEKGKKEKVRPIESYVPVKNKLVLSTHLTNRTVAVGNRVKLSCCVQGPEPQMKWTKNGNSMVFGPKIKNLSRDGLGILEFTSPTTEDSGEYVCIAKNSYSEITTSCFLDVYVGQQTTDVPPTFTRSLKDTYHLNTNDLIIEAHVRGQPKPNVIWIKDAQPIQNSDKFHQIFHEDGTCELIINRPALSDSGKYICSAENKVQKTEMVHHVQFDGKDSHIAGNMHGAFHINHNRSKEHDQKKIYDLEDIVELENKKGKKEKKGERKGRDKGPAPKQSLLFAAQLTDRVIAEGSKIKLSCYVQGPDPQLKWLKNEIPVAFGPKIKNLSKDGLGAVEFISAKIDDSGVYTCIAKNSTSEISSSANLIVYKNNTNADMPPTFTRAVKDTYYANSNELILECHVRGLPTPEISWIRDAQKIEKSGKYQQIDHEDGKCELIIDNPSRMDSGKYICCAENRVKKEEISHMVEFERPTNPLVEIKTRIKTEENVISEEDKNVNKGEVAEISATDKKSTEKKGGKKGKEGEHRRRGMIPLPDPKTKLHFAAQLATRTVPVGTKMKLTCHVHGPEPQIKWLKNNAPMSYGPKIRNQTKESVASIEFLNISMDDSGEYTCVAKNMSGEVSTTSRINVYENITVDVSKPIFTRSLMDTYYIQEDELVLECRVRGQPKPDITWYMDGQPIQAGLKYRQFDQSDGYCKLIINTPCSADNGVYTCKAENAIHNDKISHAVEFVGKDQYILEKTHGFFHRDPTKPHFSNLLADHIVPIGGTIALQAEVHGNVSVEWFKGKDIIQSAERFKTFSEQGVYTLSIDEATVKETGQYTCRATNAFGKADTIAHVDVVPASVKGGKPAMFLSRPETEMAFLSDDDISMSFRIQGDPKPKLTWLKGLRDITKSPRTLKEMHDDYIRFSLTRASYNDSGTYCIIARNRHGADRAFVTVTVKQRTRSLTPSSNLTYPTSTMDFTDVSYFKNPPGPIPAEPIVNDIGANHISLSWIKPYATPDAIPILGYRVDAWMVGKDGGARWVELGTTLLTTFDAFKLKQGNEYIFRVTPKNRYGWGDSVQTNIPVLFGNEVQLPEFSKILPVRMKALINTTIVLECVSKGYPKPDISWYKDGVELEEDENLSVRMIGSVSRLTLSVIKESDSGRYTCEATNKHGRVSSFSRLQVVTDFKILEADAKLKENIESTHPTTEMVPQFTMRLQDRRAQITHPVRLICQAIGYPIVEVSWFKDGVKIEENDRHGMWVEDNLYTLEISKTSIEDYGKYRAIAKNSLGFVSCQCTLVVDKGIRGYIAPEFSCGLNPLYIFKEHSEIHISAQIEAYPSVGVTWHRDGSKLRPNRRIFTTLNRNGLVELIISDASRYDSGIYTCIASNIVGQVESCTKVVIEELNHNENKHSHRTNALNEHYSKEPMFVKKPRSTEAYENDTVIILCEVIGDPKPEVLWLRDFLKPDYYKDAKQFCCIGDGPEYRLEIPNAKIDFTGTYSVSATNCHGEAKAIISLQIYANNCVQKGKTMDNAIKHSNIETLPEFTRHLKDLRCCDGDSIAFECHVEAIPEPTIFWEKDGRLIPHTDDFKTEYNGKVAKLTIHRIYPEDEGEYSCIGSNIIGKNYSSACIVVDVPEEKENTLSLQLERPDGFRSGNSTPRSTPARSLSPSRRFSYNKSQTSINPRNYKHSGPRFLSVPHNRVAEEGETVTFECTLGGLPSPWSTWDKNGIVLTPTPRIILREKDDHRILEIQSITQEDAGLYRITLENEYGRIETSARLDIINFRGSTRRMTRSISTFPKPNFTYTRRLMGNATRIGGRLALSCDYRGTNTSAKKYYHNGKEIQESDRITMKCSNNYQSSHAILFIENVQLTDGGEYSCIFTTEKGIITTSTSVQIYNTKEDIPKHSPKVIEKLKNEIKSKEGSPLDLIFSIKSSEPYTYTWRCDDEILNNSEDFSYIDYGQGVIGLRIRDPFVFDSGKYSCTISSKNGKCITACNVIITEILEKYIERSPKFLKIPSSLVVTVGSMASFSCQIEPLTAKIEWAVCGRNITNETTGYSIARISDGIEVLHILSVEHQHSGEIKCTAYLPKNELDSVVTYIDLVVLPKMQFKPPEQMLDLRSLGSEPRNIPASIIKGPNDNAVLIGDSVTLHVSFAGYPKPNVKWMRAGRIVKENNTIKIKTENGYSTLYLTNITADQSGKYTVEIMNNSGADFSSASVAVEGVPDAPRKPSISKGNKCVSIAWCGPPYDGGCVLTGFILEMQRDNSNWTVVASIVDSLAYTVKNLSSTSLYRFRIRAENIHGCSEASLPSEDVTFEETFNLNLHKVNLKKNDTFRSCFEILEELGKGRFGTVHKIIERDTGSILAAKIIKCIKAKDRVKVQEEISIMKSLKHDKLLQLAASFESPKEIVMVMEYITGGELFERVVADDFTLTERDCVLFIRQICEGVQYMHKKSIVHLDLKPENIMCHTRTSHQIKIIDFGLAQRLDQNIPMRVLFGTPEFIPPEIINYEPIGFESDMWSVGVICYVLLSGLSPFMGDTDVDTFSNITRADYDFEDDAFYTVSQDAKDFIASLLIDRKEERLTADECLEYPWLSLRNDKNTNNIKICTDKLKKFIIRRKWQKTGNAIRALGRMVTLSANSRRNSAASATFNSPRPSLSGCLIRSFTSHLNLLTEEENNSFEQENKLNSKTCTERSDSGFSECSNCNPQQSKSFCAGSHLEIVCPISEEKTSEIINDLRKSSESFQTKLEKICEIQEFHRET